MYGLGVWENGKNKYVKSHEIADLIVKKRNGHPGAMKHLYAIEALESRGMKYSNHDFDVLSAAYSFANAGLN